MIFGAIRNDIIPVIVGFKWKRLGLGWKLKIVARAIEQIESDLILFADAFDSIIVHSEDEIVRKFRQFNHPFMCSAETNCHADARIALFYPVALTRYRYLNSGGWIAGLTFMSERCGAAVAYANLLSETAAGRRSKRRGGSRSTI